MTIRHPNRRKTNVPPLLIVVKGCREVNPTELHAATSDAVIRDHIIPVTVTEPGAVLVFGAYIGIVTEHGDEWEAISSATGLNATTYPTRAEAILAVLTGGA